MPERVYIGVSDEAGKTITRLVGSTLINDEPGNVDFRYIDRVVVHSPFLDAMPEKPARIVLESTPEGYKVVEGGEQPL